MDGQHAGSRIDPFVLALAAFLSSSFFPVTLRIRRINRQTMGIVDIFSDPPRLYTD